LNLLHPKFFRCGDWLVLGLASAARMQDQWERRWSLGGCEYCNHYQCGKPTFLRYMQGNFHTRNKMNFWTDHLAFLPKKVKHIFDPLLLPNVNVFGLVSPNDLDARSYPHVWSSGTCSIFSDKTKLMRKNDCMWHEMISVWASYGASFFINVVQSKLEDASHIYLVGWLRKD